MVLTVVESLRTLLELLDEKRFVILDGTGEVAVEVFEEH